MLKGQVKQEQELIILNDDFFPDLDVEEFKQVRTIPINTNINLLKMALVMAMSSINRQLDSFKAQQQARGVKKIENAVQSLPDEFLNVYKIAVFARAKADLVGEWVTTANQKEKINENQTNARNELLAESSRAVRHLAGLNRIGVALL